jgi:hypothetical protein
MHHRCDSAEIHGSRIAHAALALVTLMRGWRIIPTVGPRLTNFKPRTCFCTEGGAAISIFFATFIRLPIPGAIADVGSIQRVKAVRWGVAEHSLGVDSDNSSGSFSVLGATVCIPFLRRTGITPPFPRIH